AVGAVSGATEIAAAARVLWSAATSFCLMTCAQIANHVADIVAPPGTPSFSSMGSWVAESTAGRSARAMAYEVQITGNVGQAFQVKGVRFDGFGSSGWLEAKGPGYEQLLNTKFGQSIRQGFLKQAADQLRAANGAPVTWHFAEKG